MEKWARIYARGSRGAVATPLATSLASRCGCQNISSLFIKTKGNSLLPVPQYPTATLSTSVPNDPSFTTHYSDSQVRILAYSRNSRIPHLLTWSHGLLIDITTPVCALVEWSLWTSSALLNILPYTQKHTHTHITYIALSSSCNSAARRLVRIGGLTELLLCVVSLMSVIHQPWAENLMFVPNLEFKPCSCSKPDIDKVPQKLCILFVPVLKVNTHHMTSPRRTWECAVTQQLALLARVLGTEWRRTLSTWGYVLN